MLSLFFFKDMVLPPLRSGRSLYQQPLAALFVRLSPVILAAYAAQPWCSLRSQLVFAHVVRIILAALAALDERLRRRVGGLLSSTFIILWPWCRSF